MTLFAPILASTVDTINAAGTLGVTVTRSRMMPTKDTALPAALAFVRTSRSRSDGNGSAPSFDRTVSIGIVYRCKGVDGPDLEARLDAGATAIVDALFHNPDWVGAFEDIPDYSVTFAEVKGTEPLVAEAQIAISVADGEVFEPIIPDALVTVVDVQPDVDAPAFGTIELPQD